MVLRGLIRIFGCVLLTTAAGWVRAATFTSADGAFTLDMPSGWSEVTPLPAKSVLTVQKGSSRIDIKTIACTTETCIEQKINNDLVEVKRKNMQVVGNSYTGEEVKRIEFSTGEPFFYISFFSPKNDFGAGYFLINSKAYSILARDLTYAETDLIFSFISPTGTTNPAQTPVETEEQPITLEMNLQDPRAYDIAAVPAVEEENIQAPLDGQSSADTAEPTQTAVAKNKQPSRLKARLRFFKKRLMRIKPRLLAPNIDRKSVV